MDQVRRLDLRQRGHRLCRSALVGHCISKNCRAQEAVWALEDACIKRFGILPRGDAGVVVRSDNGLVFASRLYRRLLASYGLRQEFIHPHTPEQNGVVEAYHKTFKRECVWQHRFATIEQAYPRYKPMDRSLQHHTTALEPRLPLAGCLAGAKRGANNLTQCLVLAGSLHGFSNIF